MTQMSAMKKVHVGLSEMKISQQSAETLVARDIGTGMSIALHDPVRSIGGVYHIMLPYASIYPEMARKNPLLFVDTGLPIFIQSIYENGGEKERLVVNLAGGADLISTGRALFSIGRQNYLRATEVLKQNNLRIQNSTIGGNKVRSMFLNIGSGQAWIETN